MEEFLWTDSESLYAKLKYQEKQLKLKRRWLMGVTLSDSEQKQLHKMKLRENMTLPESFLREDDVYYETIKAFVEKGFGAFNYEIQNRVDPDSAQIPELSVELKSIFSLLDDMTSKGLQLFAEVLTGGSMMFEKTRWKMKKIIRELLPEVLENWKDKNEKNTAENLCKVLRNPQNFHRNSATPFTGSPQSYHSSVRKLLDRLEDMPFQTLSAMHRKLRGVHGHVPQLQHSKSGWGRNILIDHVRKICMTMLSELDEEDELQEPLAKAMSVVILSVKLMQGSPFILPEFWKFSPEIEALQNGIAKAIRLLNLKHTVKFSELKNLQQLLDPNSELPSRSLRTAVKNILTEYLFDCSDMDTVPECLLETLSIINNRTSRSTPRRFLSMEEVEEEVEYVLTVSAQIKQVSCDLLPEYEFDLDFVDAYMEELEESDDGDGYDVSESVVQLDTVLHQNNSCHSHDSYGQIEAIGETDAPNSESPHSPIKENVFSSVLTPNKRLRSDSLDRIEPENITMNYSSVSFSSPFSSAELDGVEIIKGNNFHIVSVRDLDLSDIHSIEFKTTPSGSATQLSQIANHVEGSNPNVDDGNIPDFVSSNLSYRGNFMHDKKSMIRNQYVAVQEACDKTSIVAYRLIGWMLDEFAQIEGFDLDCSDASYLRGDSSLRRDSEVAKDDHIANKEEVHGSIIIQALQELLPSFPESGKERVKQLMGLN